jgi:hypothetical protein
VVIDDPKIMKEFFNEPAFSGRLQGEVFTAFANGSYGNFGRSYNLEKTTTKLGNFQVHNACGCFMCTID